MVLKCCVPNCKGNYDRNNKAHVFKFPKGEVIQQRWLRAIHRQDYRVTNYSVVCHRHFKDSDVLWEVTASDSKTGKTVTAPLPRPRLSENAVPCIFPSCPSYLSSHSASSREEPDKKRGAKITKKMEEMVSLKSNTVQSDKNSSEEVQLKAEYEPEPHVWVKEELLFKGEEQVTAPEETRGNQPSYSECHLLTGDELEEVQLKTEYKSEHHMWVKEEVLIKEEGQFTAPEETYEDQPSQLERHPFTGDELEVVKEEVESDNLMFDLFHDECQKSNKMEMVTLKSKPALSQENSYLIVKEEVESLSQIVKEESEPLLQIVKEEVESLSQIVKEEVEPLSQIVKEEVESLSQIVKEESEPLLRIVKEEEEPLLQIVKEEGEPLLRIVKEEVEDSYEHNNLQSDLFLDEDQASSEKVAEKGSSDSEECHQEFSAEHSDTETYYKCDLCSKTFSRRAYIRKHIKFVHAKEKKLLGLYKCEKCPKMFTQRLYLRKHVKFVHVEEKKFECPHCGKPFKFGGSVRQHVALVHRDERKYPCPHCSSKFKSSSSLKKHLNFHRKMQNFQCPEQSRQPLHEGGRAFRCNLCLEEFPDRSQLVSHRDVHLGKEDYRCTVCLKVMNSRIGLLKHMSRIHSEEKNYQCTFCFKKFLHIHSFVKHTQSNHQFLMNDLSKESK